MGTILQTTRERTTQKYIPQIGPGRSRGNASKIDCGSSAWKQRKGGACCCGYEGHAVQGLHRSSTYHDGTQWQRRREGFGASRGLQGTMRHLPNKRYHRHRRKDRFWPHVAIWRGWNLSESMKDVPLRRSRGNTGGTRKFTIHVASHGWRWCSTSIADISSTSMTVTLHILLAMSRWQTVNSQIIENAR